MAKTRYARLLRVGDRFLDFGAVREVMRKPEMHGNYWYVFVGPPGSITFTAFDRVELVD